MACTLAESPSDPFHRKLRQPRCLRCRFDCYRVERTSSRTGVAPAEVQRLSRRTFSTTTEWNVVAVVSQRLSFSEDQYLPAIYMCPGSRGATSPALDQQICLYIR